MGSFGTAFLQTTADAANKKFAEKTAEDTKIKDEQRKMYWGIAYDTTGQYNDAQKSAALEQYNKLVPASLRKPSQKFNQIFGTLTQAAKAHAASQDGQQPTQPGAQPSPANKLSSPSTPAPASSAAPVAAAAAPAAPGGMAQPATPKPSPSATSQLTGPKTSAPQPQQQNPPRQQAQSGVPIMSDAEIQHREDARGNAARQDQIFKTDEQIRAKVAEDKATADAANEKRQAQIKAIDDDPQLTPEEKKQGHLDAWGIKMPPPEALTPIHYEDSKGDWHPALHDARGNLMTLDRKPIDLAGVQDIRPEPPAAEKPTGEYAQRLEAQNVIDNTGGKSTKTEIKAAKDTLHSLDEKAKGVQVRVDAAAEKIKQDAAGSSDDDIQAAMPAARAHALYGVPAPPLGMAQSPQRKAFNTAYLRVISELTPEQLAKDRSDFKAGTANLVQLERQSGIFEALEGAFDRDLENARTASKAVPRTSMQKVNNVTQLFKSAWTDDPALAQLKVATQTAVNQYAKVATSVTGQTTDTARGEAMALLDKAMAKGTFDAALDQMEKEAHNRIAGIDEQVEKQKARIGTPSPNAQKDLAAPLPGSTDSTVQKLLDKYK